MILNVRILRMLFFVLNYFKWRLLGLRSKSFVRIYPQVKMLNPGYIEIDENVMLFSGCVIKALKATVFIGRNKTMSQGKVAIGKNTSVGEYSLIDCFQNIVIGKNVLIAPQCYIGDGNHVFEDRVFCIRQQGNRASDVIIGDDVWIGTGARILSGVNIGKGSVIAAGAVVATNIPEYTLYGGVPARKIKDIRLE